MKRALVATVVVAVVSGLLTTPDVIIQVFTSAFSFAAIFGILFVCLHIMPVEHWSLARQRTFTWLIAGVVGASFVLMPSAMKFLGR